MYKHFCDFELLSTHSKEWCISIFVTLSFLVLVRKIGVLVSVVGCPTAHFVPESERNADSAASLGLGRLCGGDLD